MNVSDIRNFTARHLDRLLAAAPIANVSPNASLRKPIGPAGAPKRPQPAPTMSLDRWGTILEIGPSRVGDRFALGRIRFRTDDGAESTFLIERGRTYVSFNWLDDRGVWQRKRASFHDLKPGMRAEVWGEAGAAEAVLVEGLPRVTA